jgi:hypothetical protein
MIFSPGGQHSLFDYLKEVKRERSLIATVLQEGIDAGMLRGNARELATQLMGMQLMVSLEFLFLSRSVLTRRRAEKCVDLLLRGCMITSGSALPAGKVKDSV